MVPITMLICQTDFDMKNILIALFLLSASPLLAQMTLLADTPPAGDYTYDSGTFSITADVYDQEEQIDANAGAMEWNSSDLELLAEGGNDEQIVGLQYVLTVPQGAIIDNAYIQFTKDSGGSGTSLVRFRAEDVDNSSALTSSLSAGYFSDILTSTSTSPTTASVNWNINVTGWNSDATGAAGANQKSTDISSVIQEIVNRAGWSSGNRILILIDSVTLGEVEAESYNGGGESQAPKLTVEYHY